jgi:hypothetical protein
MMTGQSATAVHVRRTIAASPDRESALDALVAVGW